MVYVAMSLGSGSAYNGGLLQERLITSLAAAPIVPAFHAGAPKRLGRRNIDDLPPPLSIGQSDRY